MRVFVAGGTGVLGRRPVPQLVTRGHQVTATPTSAAKKGLGEQLGAEAVVMAGAGTKRLMRAPAWPARLPAREGVVTMMTEGGGFSDTKVRREPGRELRRPSWRQGFEKGPA
ncbi:hypothetical protein ACFYWX_34785 [Streptomyces sp. NPDC002888]|uniref:hypothetical protein n=1 Tax=Streptomyces sp. NPDC002888 TaxID=3364668 RepID=UPI0036936613